MHIVSGRALAQVSWRWLDDGRETLVRCIRICPSQAKQQEEQQLQQQKQRHTRLQGLEGGGGSHRGEGGRPAKPGSNQGWKPEGGSGYRGVEKAELVQPAGHPQRRRRRCGEAWWDPAYEGRMAVSAGYLTVAWFRELFPGREFPTVDAPMTYTMALEVDGKVMPGRESIELGRSGTSSVRIHRGSRRVPAGTRVVGWRRLEGEAGTLVKQVHTIGSNNNGGGSGGSRSLTSSSGDSGSGTDSGSVEDGSSSEGENTSSEGGEGGVAIAEHRPKSKCHSHSSAWWDRSYLGPKDSTSARPYIKMSTFRELFPDNILPLKVDVRLEVGGARQYASVGARVRGCVWGTCARAMAAQVHVCSVHTCERGC